MRKSKKKKHLIRMIRLNQLKSMRMRKKIYKEKVNQKNTSPQKRVSLKMIPSLRKKLFQRKNKLNLDKVQKDLNL